MGLRTGGGAQFYDAPRAAQIAQLSCHQSLASFLAVAVRLKKAHPRKEVVAEADAET
jgi:hypothetical protein